MPAKCSCAQLCDALASVVSHLFWPNNFGQPNVQLESCLRSRHDKNAFKNLKTDMDIISGELQAPQ